ncbi:hypothetical protein GK047_15000 [Paenibacillus sp. SYP-B3998]|uniref:Uncharacterized protein n=1 Tax=Paenibacillus sp. SYP-B3998 TaxID=2678564 RepID=A0A6G3ZYV2_9BACL|nr:hypothetical protein [Paenibacillus sp. SYP-B3998]NEW07312.1 hypothetical protein [Paenibacillus sp. SYP-B3998]
MTEAGTLSHERKVSTYRVQELKQTFHDGDLRYARKAAHRVGVVAARMSGQHQLHAEIFNTLPYK